MDDALFEWDIEKARTNLAKHGVSFDEACLAVLDPHRVEIIDDRFDYDEERLQIIGLSSQRILLVVTIPCPRSSQDYLGPRRQPV